MDQDAIKAGVEALKSTPAVTITTLSLFGFPLSEWVYVLTLILLVLQIVSLVKRELTGKPLFKRRVKNGSNKKE